MTLFNTPVVTPLLRFLAGLCMRLAGWRLEHAGHESPAPPCVLIASPHTSNLDFLLMLAGALTLSLRINWFGKHTLFRFPFGCLMRWMGGIAIDRTRSNRIVESMAAAFAENPELILVVPPEGTRSRVERWKSGFYHIARLAQVPVVMVAVDGENRALKLLGSFSPDQEDPETAREAIAELRRQKFSQYRGIRPEKR